MLQKIPELIEKAKRIGEQAGVSRERLDKLIVLFDREGYSAEDLEQPPLVDNPQVRQLKQPRAGLVSELSRLKIELADHLLQRPTRKRRSPPRSQKEVLDHIALVESTVRLTDQQLDKLPPEIRFDEAQAGKKLLKLNHEKKRFLDCIKVFACNLQAEMCRRLLKHDDWQKEVLPALAMIVERTGYVKLEGGRLEVGGGCARPKSWVRRCESPSGRRHRH